MPIFFIKRKAFNFVIFFLTLTLSYSFFRPLNCLGNFVQDFHNRKLWEEGFQRKPLLNLVQNDMAPENEINSIDYKVVKFNLRYKL